MSSAVPSNGGLPASGIVLTMIVRNEERVIERCLESVRDVIDGYVICDTGSTDNTIERIESYLSDVPGVIHRRPWVSFGHNRSELAELARGSGDHHLLLDADMVMEFSEGVPPLEKGIAYLVRHRGEADYFAPRFVDGDIPWRWKGSTHETLVADVPFRHRLLEGVRVIHHGDGAGWGRTRLERDLGLLSQDYDEDPSDPRTNFYLGLVLLGLGEVDRGVFHLERRLEGPLEPRDEPFYAALRIAMAVTAQGGDGLTAAKRALEIDDTRAEAWLVLAQAHLQRGRFRAARRAALRAKSCTSPDLVSFVLPGASDWRADRMLASIAYARGATGAALTSMSRQLDEDLPAPVRLKAHEHLELAWMWRHRGVTRMGRLPRLDITRAWQVLVEAKPQWWATNPCIADAHDGHHLTVRLTNIGSAGQEYRKLDHRVAGSLNLTTRLDKDFEVGAIEPIADPAYSIPAQPAATRGTEDLRLIEAGGRRLAIGWSREFVGGSVLGPVILDIDSETAWSIRQPDPDRHEKNWAPFVRDGRLHLMTVVDPLTIYAMTDDGGFELVAARPAVGGWHGFRGGSQGVRVDDGWLFVIHERLSYPGTTRFAHRFVLVDEDLTLAGVGPRFSLTGAPIEFVAGLATLDDELVLSFGVADSVAALVTLPRSAALGALEGPPPRWRTVRRRKDLVRWPRIVSHWSPAPALLERALDAESTAVGTRRQLPRTANVAGVRLQKVDDIEALAIRQLTTDTERFTAR